MGLNNVDTEKLKQTIEAFTADPSKAKKVNTVEGEWSPGGGPQFSATVTFEGGTATLEADQPTGLGGGGSTPGAMIYCLYGSASCYAATFATFAAMVGGELQKMTLKAEAKVEKVAA